MSKKSIYRVIFANQDAVYEIYARQVYESEMFGFIEIEDFVFGENTSLVIDPSEERLKIEFSQVKRTIVPMHSIFRIDEVNKQGVGKVWDKIHEHNKVRLFPVPDKG
jgi:hypothetical protein